MLFWFFAPMFPLNRWNLLVCMIGCQTTPPLRHSLCLRNKKWQWRLQSLNVRLHWLQRKMTKAKLFAAAAKEDDDGECLRRLLL